MSQQIVSMGSSAVTLQDLVTIFVKVNENFSEIAGALPSVSFQTINFVEGGDSLSQAFTKVNNNFSAAFVLTGSTQEVINLSGGSADTIGLALTKIDNNFTSLYTILSLTAAPAPEPYILTLSPDPILTTTAYTTTITSNITYDSGQQIIDLGDGPDTYTGDSLYVAFSKVNHNFTELYGVFDGNGISEINANVITANNINLSTNVRTGNLFAYGNIESVGYIVTSGAFYPNGVPIGSLGAIDSNIIPLTSNLFTIGSITNQFTQGYFSKNITLAGSNVTTVNGQLYVDGALVSGNYSNANVIAFLPNYSGNLNAINSITASGNISANYFLGNGRYLSGIDATSIQNGNSNVKVYLNSNVDITTAGITTWNFDTYGNLNFPGGSKLNPSGTYNENIDLIAGQNGWAELQSFNANNYVWVDDVGAYIGTNWLAGSKVWIFGTDGNFSLPGNLNVDYGQIEVAGYKVIDANGNVVTSQLQNSGVVAGTYGNASTVPSVTVDSKGRITSVANVAVSGVSNVTYNSVTGNLTIATSSGTTYVVDLGIGTADSPQFVNLTLTGNLTANKINATTVGNTGAVLIGNGAAITSLTGANVTGTVPYALTATYVTGLTGTNVNVALGYVPLNSNATALTAQYVTQANQANITSVGILTGLTLNGTLTGTTLNAAIIGNAGSSLVGSTLNISGNATVNALTINNSATIGSTLAVTGNITAPYIIGNVVGNISGNITAPGITTQVLFNDAGLISGNTGLTYDKTTANLTVLGNVTSGGFTTNASGIFGTTLQALGGVQNTPIGNGTASTGTFTTLTASSITVSGNAIIGNLDVLGNVTYINSTVTTIIDPILELNTGPNGAPLSGNAPFDSGIKTHYWDGTADRQAFFGRTNDTGNFEFYSNVTSETANVVTGTYGTIKTGNLVLTGTGSIGTTLSVGGNATVNALTSNNSITAITTISGLGGLQATPIGNVTPSTALFTTVGASGNATVNALSVNNNATISGTLDVLSNITALYFIGNGSTVSSITGANVTGTVANATYALQAGQSNFANTAIYVTGLTGTNVNVALGYVPLDSNATALTAQYVTQATQSNITSVGTLTGLTLSGTLTGTILNAAIIGNTGAAIVGSTLNTSSNATVNALTVNNTITVGSTIGATGNITAPNFIGNVIGNISGNITSPGTTTQVIFNDNGLLAGDAGITYNKNTDNLTVLGNITAGGYTTNASGVFGATLQAIGGLQATPIGNTTPSTALFTTVGSSGNSTVNGFTVNLSATVGTTLGVTGNITGGNVTTAGLITATATTAATSNVTGAVQVGGGIGVAGNIYVGQRVGFVAANSVSAVYQVYNNTTNSLDTIFG